MSYSILLFISFALVFRFLSSHGGEGGGGGVHSAAGEERRLPGAGQCEE